MVQIYHKQLHKEQTTSELFVTYKKTIKQHKVDNTHKILKKISQKVNACLVQLGNRADLLKVQ